MNKKIIIWGVIVVVLVAGGVWMFTKGDSSTDGGAQSTTKLDAVDTVEGFYGDWLTALKSPTTADPNLATLATSDMLSKTLSEQIVKAQALGTKPDPVMCQKVVPEGISTRTIYEKDKEAQMLVTSRDKKVAESAIVTLTKSGDEWTIEKIECSLGEVAPVKEFSFEKQGFLLKTSVPKPFDSKNWHLVFEENGELGHVVPLFFDTKSQCIKTDGTKAVCKPAEFKEATKVMVYGQMSERGATVVKLEFVK